MQSFMHFIAKNYLWPETGTRELNQTAGDWRCKRHEGWKYSRGSTPPTPR